MPGQDSTPLSFREENVENEARETGFYNIQDGQKGRDGGPYLDHQERVQAEIQRAFREDREPKLDGPLPAAIGTVLVTAPLVPENSLTSNPSMAYAPGLESAVSDETYKDAKHLADPIAVLPVDTRTEVSADDSGDPYRVTSKTGTTLPNADNPVVRASNKSDKDAAGSQK